MAKDAAVTQFQQTVWQHFELFGRHDLPWRSPEVNGLFDPYKILVSEVMLQQTQVSRVVPKYLEFLDAFPDSTALANAKLAQVLRVWNGLGYNRRAKFLWQAAQAVQQNHGGQFPTEIAELVKLPGVGKNTAGAIAAYAFNQPVPFVETNIRTVYIFHFFENRQNISDVEILEVITKTIDPHNSRTWHWALMDYGSFLKQSVGNLSKLSKSYAKQSPFNGSTRQIRGQVIRLLSTKPMTKAALAKAVHDERLDAVLDDLLKEALIKKSASTYSLR